MRAESGRAPTRLDLLAMAYVDGELSDSARHEFQARMRGEPALMRQVEELAALRTLLHQVGANLAPKGAALTP